MSGGEEVSCCTFAVTKENVIFQPIYVCHSCFPSEASCCSICESCAERCHANHDGLEYMGVGPSYCDCHTNSHGCSLLETSHTMLRQLHHSSSSSIIKPSSFYDSTINHNHCNLEYKVYTIPSLIQSINNDYIQQAKTLVSYTKETHWLSPLSQENLCGLEQLVYSILQQHNHIDDDVGAEWWVQVSSSNQKGVVDLHYDKDERLASLFGLGHFPLISTVTYLSDNNNDSPQLPTIIFPHSYFQECEMQSSKVLISYPKRGKHLQFNGTYLHGVPYIPTTTTTTSTTRVTLLVNIWKSWKPLGIQSLPSDIRQSIIQQSSSSKHYSCGSSQPFWEEYTHTVPTISVTNNEDDEPFYLPFVSKDATWIDDDDDEENDQLMVALYPPPLPKDTNNDTILYQYDESFAPQFYRVEEDEEESFSGE